MKARMIKYSCSHLEKGNMNQRIINDELVTTGNSLTKKVPLAPALFRVLTMSLLFMNNQLATLDGVDMVSWAVQIDVRTIILCS